jgi:hypothetical protein
MDPTPTVNTAPKVGTLMESLASKLINVELELTLISLPENAPLAEFPSALSA